MRRLLLFALLPSSLLGGCGGRSLQDFVPELVDVEATDGLAFVSAYFSSGRTCGDGVDLVTATINGTDASFFLSDEFFREGQRRPSLFSPRCSMVLDAVLTYDDDAAIDDITVSVDTGEDGQRLEVSVARALPHAVFTDDLDGPSLDPGDDVHVTVSPALPGFEVNGRIDAEGALDAVEDGDGYTLTVSESQPPGDVTLALTLVKTVACDNEPPDDVTCNAIVRAVHHMPVTVADQPATAR